MWNGMILDDELPVSGCSWPIISTCPVTVPPVDDAIKEWSEQMAIEILWAASGRQFGVCASTYRPCRKGCEGGRPTVDAWNLVSGGWLRSDPWGGSVFARIGCGCGDYCTCSTIEAFDLWHRNVLEVTRVVIDGVIMDPGNYRLSKNRLIRTDGDVWPVCQDYNVNPGEVGSWTVSYVHGAVVPVGGRVSAGILACQLQLAALNSEDCELPERVQTVTRAGVTIGFIDPMQFLDQGRTGVYTVDMWLASVNPKHLIRRARIHRVDDPRRLARGR